MSEIGRRDMPLGTGLALAARGKYDGIVTEQDLLGFMAKLATPDRQYSVIPGAAHSLSMGLARARYWHVIHGFLSMPA